MSGPKISKLPKYIGIFADYHYPKRHLIHNLIMQLNPRSTVVTTELSGIEDFIERTSVLRGNLFFKKFESDPWEEQTSSKNKAEKVRDYLFISYLKFMKGRLFIFPQEYDTATFGVQYSKRTQEIILLAHTLKVKYSIISSEDYDE